jgi:TPR repeat protein
VRPQAPPDAPVTLEGLAVPEVIARAASPAAIAQEAARRYETGRYDDALLLWEAAARAGNAAALTRLAGLYDPVGFTPGRPFRDPDPRQAARHYREAVTAGDAAAAEPRARLRQWLDDRAREGDLNAPLTIRDFWQ